MKRKKREPVEPEEKGAPVTSERLASFYEKWKRNLFPDRPPPEPEPPEPPPKGSAFLIFLKLLPYLSLSGFLISIGWDLTGTIRLPWSEEPVLLDGLVRIITVSGLIGYGTNWIAIKMLFYPRMKRPLLGQGLIPAKKDEIVERLGESIANEIINADLILEQIRRSGLIQSYRLQFSNSVRRLTENEEFRTDLIDLLQYYINAFLSSKNVQSRIREFIDGIDFANIKGFEAGVFRIYRMIKGKDMSERIRELIRGVTFDLSRFDKKIYSYLDSLPSRIHENADSIEEYSLKTIVFVLDQINIRKVISDNLNRFDERRLENLLLKTTSDQLQYIQYLGCLLGLLGGLFIWRPVESFILGTLFGLTIWGVDAAILELRRRGAQRRSFAELKERDRDTGSID